MKTIRTTLAFLFLAIVTIPQTMRADETVKTRILLMMRTISSMADFDTRFDNILNVGILPTTSAPVREILEKVAKKQIGGKLVNLELVSNDNIAALDLVYIENQAAPSEKLWGQIKDARTIVVSDATADLSHGATLAIETIAGRPQLHINSRQLRRLGMALHPLIINAAISH